MRNKEMVYRAANKNAPVYLKTDHDFAAHTSELANVMSPSWIHPQAETHSIIDFQMVTHGCLWLFLIICKVTNGKKKEGWLWSAISSLLHFAMLCWCWRSFVWWVTERERTGDTLQSNNWILFNHLHKSFHMSAADSQSFIPSQEQSQCWGENIQFTGNC